VDGAPVPCVKDGHVVPGTCGGNNPPRAAAGGRAGGGPARGGRAAANFKTEDEGYGAIRAIDPQTGEKKWDFKMSNYTESGVLSTAGGLVVVGGMDGTFVALDARTGEVLWHAYLGGPNASGPISYAVNGKQYIIGTGEGTMYSFALPD
jgi:outer membrane protein assembly factor BamB